MNDLEYLNLFKKAEMRVLIMQYFLERKYGIETLIKYSNSSESYPIPDYSSWILVHLVKNYPNQMKDYQAQFIDVFINSQNQTVLRNISAALTLQRKIDYKEGEFYNVLIRHLNDSNNKIALHVNCVYKLIQFATQYPELKNEIQETINYRINISSQPSLLAAIRKFEKLT